MENFWETDITKESYSQSLITSQLGFDWTDISHGIDSSVNTNKYDNLFKEQIVPSTLAALTLVGSHYWLDRTALCERIGVRSPIQTATAAFIGAAAAILANAETSSLIKDKSFASWSDILEAGKLWAPIGLAFGASTHFLRRPQLASAIGKDLPTTEKFVLGNNVTGLRSPILNIIAENNPELRPANFQTLYRSFYNDKRELQFYDLADWEPHRRPAVIQELRRIARTDLAEDRNIDVVLQELSKTNWARKGQTKSTDPVSSDLLSNNATPEAGAEAATKTFLSRFAAIKNGIFDSDTNEIQAALNKIARTRFYPPVKVSTILDGGAEVMGLRHIRFGDKVLSTGLTARSGSTIFHEFVHIDEGPFSPSILKASFSRTPREDREAMKLYSLQSRRKGFDDDKDLVSAVENTVIDLFDLPKDLRQDLKYVHRLEANSKPKWDEDLIRRRFQQHYDERIASTQDRIYQARQNYYLRDHEQRGFAGDLLAEIRGRILGLPHGN